MSSQNNILEIILKNHRTVFNTQSLMMLSGCGNAQKLSRSLHYYVETGRIRNPRRGIYTKDRYDEKELACSIFRPSYLSLEYVLQRHGIIFQYDDTVTCVSYLNRMLSVDGIEYLFRNISRQIWCGMEGIEQQDNICMASPERAFLDMLYLSAGNCSFDNLRPLDKKKVMALAPLYNSKVLTKRVYNLLNLTK